MDMFSKILAVVLFFGNLCYGVPNQKDGWRRSESDLSLPSDPFIVGGDIVNGREYPSLISLRVANNHNCGGTILSPEWILTAAQCGKGYHASDLSIVAGSNLLDQGGSEHQVLEIIVHEDYSVEHSWRNDLCVMKVGPPIDLNSGTAAVTLETDTQDPPNDSSATVVGWGMTSSPGTMSNDLRKAIVPVVERTACQGDYGSDEVIYESQICAGGKGDKDVCSGDAGGPLFVNDKQVGIVSWGKPCAYVGYPSVYTEVSHYTDWITHHTQ